MNKIKYSCFGSLQTLQSSAENDCDYCPDYVECFEAQDKLKAEKHQKIVDLEKFLLENGYTEVFAKSMVTCIIKHKEEIKKNLFS